MTAAHPLDLTKLRIAPLPDRAALDDFDCDEREIDRGIEKCCEWHRKYRSRVFCGFLGDNPTAFGFYCLGISAADAKHLDRAITRENEGRSFVPFIYLNYLAVRKEYQSQKIGTMLLINALERCATFVRNVGIYGVALHAINERVLRLYSRYGFRQIDDKKFPFMILPAQSLIDLIESARDA